MTKREYGLQIERLNQHGTEYVQVIVCRRDPDKDYPLGCSSDGESQFDSDVPKHLHGLMVDGLGMYGFVTEYDDNAFIAYAPEYRNVFAMDEQKLVRMVRTLKRVNARIRKDDARDIGDQFAALAAALKLTFVVERTTPRHQRFHQWRWMSVAEGRNRYRELVDRARTDAQVQKMAGGSK